MRKGIFFLAIILATFAAGTGRANEPARPTADPRVFPRPAALEPQIRFWKSIFAEYSVHQVVLHDALHLDKVYKVLDFRPSADEGVSAAALEAIRRDETDLELARVRAALLRLDAAGGEKPADLTADEERLWVLYADDLSPTRFRDAAEGKRLRSQRGLRERFAEAIRVSRRYLPEMERIFDAEGLPRELTRLPLIESCFNLQAYSKVGAAGIWQFMPATGRRFIRVDGLVDERRDPIASTRAAARYLNELYDHLGSWPLAVTAYNHGPYGIARAVDAVGSSDIATIIRSYRGAAFGFASRNFYPELLAALDIDADHQAHFGTQALERPLDATEVRLDRSVGIEQAARLAESDRDEIARLNPALSETVVSGRRAIPSGYRLRLPASGVAGFETRLAGLPQAEPRLVRVAARSAARGERRKGATPSRGAYLTHRVQRGQTLSVIAKKHGVSVATLRAANRMGKRSMLRAGQTLKVPVPSNEA